MAVAVATPPAAIGPAAPAPHDNWTWEEDKALELALAQHWNTPDKLVRAAAAVPTKTAEAIRRRYAALEMDVQNIENNKVRLPPFSSSAEPSPQPVAVKAAAKRGGGSSGGEERRKGVPWTEEEHRLFVAGLAEYGKGDWRSISRNYVLTRTPTQVASHAQKYFIRMNSAKKNDKRRSSIHDITSPAPPGGQPPVPRGGPPAAPAAGAMAAVRPGLPPQAPQAVVAPATAATPALPPQQPQQQQPPPPAQAQQPGQAPPASRDLRAAAPQQPVAPPAQPQQPVAGQQRAPPPAAVPPAQPAAPAK